MITSLLRTSSANVQTLRRAAVWLALTSAVLSVPWLARAEVSEACISSYEKGQELRISGRYLEAKQTLLTCAQATCPALLQRDCTTWLSEIEAALPSVVFAVTNEGGDDLREVRVSEQGQPLESDTGRALALDPGLHTLRIEAAGHQAVEQTLTIREAEKNRLVRVVLKPRDDIARAERTWFGLSVPTLALSGAALVSAGAFVGFAVHGKQEYDDLKKQCGSTCPESRTERGRRDYVIANVALASTLGFAAAAIWVYVAQRPASSSVAALQLRLSPSEASVGMDYRF
jgi:hypothetical protein